MNIYEESTINFWICLFLSNQHTDIQTRAALLLVNINTCSISIDKYKNKFLQARKFKKWLNLKENNKTICILADEKLSGNKHIKPETAFT